MLKVWRGQGCFFAECDKCCSYGTPHRVEAKTKMAPEIEEAVERHTAHMLALRASYVTSANAVANQIRAGSLKRKEGVAKIRDLWQNHIAQVHLGTAALPSPDGKVVEIVEKCPWCGAAEEVEVKALPEGKTEPDFDLAKKGAQS